MTEAEKTNLIELLDSLVTAAVPKVTKVPKYGGTLYTLKPDEKERQFCGVFPYKAHVQLSFARGSSLDDPDGVLLERDGWKGMDGAIHHLLPWPLD